MVTETDVDLLQRIRNVPDFPKKGILFRDITTLVKDRTAFSRTIDLFYDRCRGMSIDKVASIEARGFIFGAPLAYRLGVGFIPVRKPGKLPAKTLRQEYELEYGTDAVEVHEDAVVSGERVLLLDDLLATGGTAAASCKLIEHLGGIVSGVAFLVELTFLNGRKKLSGYEVFSLLTYDSE